ncbi:MAG: glycoside hydrolase family 2 protein [Bacteroidales bacterium]|nr:glycoside hydrolase family 2 protein [Bacteroidales bacterium]
MKKVFVILAPLVLLVLFACSSKQNDIQSLNQGWNLKTDTLNINLQVNIPSEAHADLYENGLIPHPYGEGDEEKQLQWIPQHQWDYSLKFDVDKDIWQNDNIDLIFNGLDTYADVWLNGEKILHSDNMFVRYEKEVKHLLKKRDNELKVRFYPFDAQRDSLIETYPLRFPEKYAVMRKAAYQNGWDWAPRYLNIGIWKDVELHGWSGFKVENVSVLTENLAGNDAEMSANIEVSCDGEHELKFVVQHNGAELARQIVFAEGKNFVKIPFELKNANLWWPNEMGEQHMTDFEIEIYENVKLVDTKKVKTGVRKIELIEEPDSIGCAMYFKVNGRKVYIKGANYVPEEMIETWMSREKTVKLLAECVPAHFNMLRVWGGGIYPPDYFFDVCDSLGIMVWQDFMFAGTTYPYSDEFLNNVKEEAIQQVINYQNHPSLALWCGNNEVSEGYVNWGWQTSMGWSDDDYAEMKRGMDTLFVDIFSQVVDTYDGTRSYWPSSPKNGWGKPESLTEGDVHYWGVWWGEFPYEMYLEKVGRFNSEFGYQAYPNIETKHQKHPRGEELIQKHIKEYVHDGDAVISNEVEKSSNDVYYSQISQAYGIGLAIEAQRAAKPYCMGTLYWQLNDAWPVISWSSIDYAGNKKALHWKLKDLYSPLLIGVLPCNKLPIGDDSPTIYICNDYYKDIDADLVINIRDFDGKLLKSHTEKVFIPENSSIYVPIFVADFTEKLSFREIYFEMQLVENDETIAERIHCFFEPKYLELKKVDLIPEITVENGIGTITLVSNTFVKDVYIWFSENSQCSDASDNFFDLEPNKTKTVTFKTKSENPDISIIYLNN